MPHETFTAIFNGVEAAGKTVTSVNAQMAAELKNLLSTTK